MEFPAVQVGRGSIPRPDLMVTLSEAVAHLRVQYCEGCQEQFSEQEILNRAQCEFCDHVESTGQMVATLQD